MSNAIALMVEFEVKPERRAEFLSLMLEHASMTLTCILHETGAARALQRSFRRALRRLGTAFFDGTVCACAISRWFMCATARDAPSTREWPCFSVSSRTVTHLSCARISRSRATCRLKAEPGCEQFDVLDPQDDSPSVFLYERYRDEDALLEHMNSALLASTRGSYDDMITSKRVVRCAVV